MAAGTANQAKSNDSAKTNPVRNLDELEETGIDTETDELREREIREFANVFALLSDETRLRILAYLMQSGELNVTELCNRLGQTQPAVSHHLALLRVSGLVEPRRSGKNNFYSVRTEHFGDLLARLLTVAGEMPKKVRFQEFTLTHQKR